MLKEEVLSFLIVEVYFLADLMRRQEELRRLEELRNQELQKRKQIQLRYLVLFCTDVVVSRTF